MYDRILIISKFQSATQLILTPDSNKTAITILGNTGKLTTLCYCIVQHTMIYKFDGTSGMLNNAKEDSVSLLKTPTLQLRLPIRVISFEMKYICISAKFYIQLETVSLVSYVSIKVLEDSFFC